MNEPVWNKFLTERDKAVFDAAGYNERAGFGDRPVIVVIDVYYNFTGDKTDPMFETSKRLQPVMRAFRPRVARYQQRKYFKRDIDAVPEIDIDCFDRDQWASTLPSLAR